MEPWHNFALGIGEEIPGVIRLDLAPDRTEETQIQELLRHFGFRNGHFFSVICLNRQHLFESKFTKKWS